MALLSEVIGWKIDNPSSFGGPIYPLVELTRLAFFFPSIAAGTRRLHDISDRLVDVTMPSSGFGSH